MVYALEHASISEKRAMGEIYFKRVLEADDALRLRGVIEELGARAACEDMAATLIGEALEAAQVSGVSEEGQTRVSAYVNELTGKEMTGAA